MAADKTHRTARDTTATRPALRGLKHNHNCAHP